MREQLGFDFTQQGTPGQQRHPVPGRAHRDVKQLQRQPSSQGASPGRAGHTAGPHDESAPSLRGNVARQAMRSTSRKPTTGQQPICSDYDIDGDRDVSPTQVPMSARRHHVPERYIQQGNVGAYIHNRPRQEYQRMARPNPHADPYAKKAGQTHGMISRVALFLSAVCLVMILGYIVITVLGSWWQIKLEDWHYGQPRTFQIDAVVGHNDSPGHPSHFIAINLNGRVIITEYPGGDASKAIMYDGPYIVGDDGLTPITLSFKDVDGDGKIDMVVHDDDKLFYYLNENGKFRPQKPGDRISNP